jgi:hypothetical protein
MGQARRVRVSVKLRLSHPIRPPPDAFGFKSCDWHLTQIAIERPIFLWFKFLWFKLCNGAR